MFHSGYSENHLDDGKHFINTNTQFTTYLMKERSPDEREKTTSLFWRTSHSANQ